MGFTGDFYFIYGGFLSFISLFCLCLAFCFSSQLVFFICCFSLPASVPRNVPKKIYPPSLLFLCFYSRPAYFNKDFFSFSFFFTLLFTLLFAPRDFRYETTRAA